jgi:cytidyltransferase-like protein
LKKAIIVSGYFNPIHKGHIEYFKNARTNGDELFVIVNSDLQLELKGSKEFQDENERVFIVESLRLVDKCFLSIDNDRTVIESIKMIFDKFGNQYDLAFANGGDQNNDTIPERPICEELGIKLLDGLGDKIQSSSWLLKKTNEDIKKISKT